MKTLVDNLRSKISRRMRALGAGQGGFTLIELLVVVIIMGVLAAVIVPNVARFANKGQTEARNTELKDIQTSMDALITEQRLAVPFAAAYFPAAGALAICDFSSAAVAASGCNTAAQPLSVAGDYLYPNWNRTNPSTNAYCWNNAGLVTQFAKGALCP